MSEPKLGAFPPPESMWQINKTAASIAFVNDCERFLSTCNDPEKSESIKKAVQKVKNGELVLTEWLSPEEYLAQSPQ